MLLITGGNGKLGRLIVEEVLRRAPDAPLAVSARDASAAADLAERGVDVRQADYGDLDSIRTAFQGVDRVLLMPTGTPDPDARVAEMIPVAQAAADAGVKHIVYPGAGEVDGLEFPLLSAHARIFEGIEATGVAATHLRHGIYAEVIAGDVAGAVAAGELAAPVGDATVAPVLRSDLAAGIATVLLDESGHEGKEYDFTGPDAISWADLADLASERAGKDIPFRAIDEDEAQERLVAAGLPEAFIPAMLGFYTAYRAGWSAPSGDLERLAGRPITPSKQAVAAVLDGTGK
jgi:NAD(P)H dehydrogenase (quinone)